MRAAALLTVTILATLCGCGDGAPPEVAPGCNPLVGGACLLPFPSSFYEIADPGTPTGRRVRVPAEVAPQQLTGTRLSVERMNRADGFSPATPILVHLPTPPAASLLPPETDLARSLDAGATVQLYDVERAERVPLWAELDGNAEEDARRALLIHPAVRLRNDARYVVALVGLGPAPRPFAALRDGRALSSALAALAPAVEETLTFLQARGVTRADVTLAWDFHTASKAAAHAHLETMRDTALAEVASLGYQVDEVKQAASGDPRLLRTVAFTIDVPSFLADESGSSTLLSDGTGAPQRRGIDKVQGFAVVPRCAAAATGPIPIVQFGAGLFLNVQTMLDSTAWQRVANEVCAVYVGTDWLGLSGSDLGLAADAALNDVNKLYVITDRLQQAHVNQLVLARLLATKLAADPAFVVGDHAAFDPGRHFYFGISNGGIQAPALLSLSSEIQRGVLNVPGCKWSLMLSRSTDFYPFKALMKDLLPDPIDQQILFVLSQTEWDHTDAATWAETLTKPVLVQEAIGDAQVSNAATRTLVRMLGIPALQPLVQSVFGVETKAAPLPSGYTQWDAHAMPLPPLGNTALPMDNIAHNSIWPSVLGIAQTKAFFDSAQVLDVCQGACTDY